MSHVRCPYGNQIDRIGQLGIVRGQCIQGSESYESRNTVGGSLLSFPHVLYIIRSRPNSIATVRLILIPMPAEP